ncbi:MAG: DHH family phosphoesterase [Candidatus Methanomethylophilaceae archaeon]|jgi:nanoRNase/pAp phosphatase (c-di-AMP/oligoRNAs hydrolase)
MEFSEIAEALAGGKKAILVHNNADMDAVGSAFALSRCFPESTICACGGIDYVAGNAVEKLGIKISDTYNPEDYDLTVVVDTSSPAMLETEVPENSIVIDHHMPSGEWKNVRFFCDENSISCCELISEIIFEAGIGMDKTTGLALLGGMITDSGHLQYAKPETLKRFARIMGECGIFMDEAMAVTRADLRMSERNAVLKTMENLKFERVGEMIVAYAVGSSFESSACKAMIGAGADVAFVATQKDDFFRISARATMDAVRKGIALGDILKDVGSDTNCNGGGHTGAAGISGTGDAEAMLNMCVSRTMDEFRRIKSESKNFN